MQNLALSLLYPCLAEISPKHWILLHVNSPSLLNAFGAQGLRHSGIASIECQQQNQQCNNQTSWQYSRANLPAMMSDSCIAVFAPDTEADADARNDSATGVDNAIEPTS